MPDTQTPPCKPLDRLHDLHTRLGEFLAGHPARHNPRAWTGTGRLSMARHNLMRALYWLGDDTIDPDTYEFRDGVK